MSPLRCVRIPVVLGALATAGAPGEAQVGSRGLPTRAAELAAADRPRWLLAIAAACDAGQVGTTWRTRAVPDSRAVLPLPPVIAADSGAVHGCCWDEFPVVPRGQYEIAPLDRITGRLVLESASAAIGCPYADQARWPEAPYVRALGYDARPDWGARGVWQVLARLPREDGWLLGMSRDLWGARALVAAMRAVRVAPRDSAPP